MTDKPAISATPVERGRGAAGKEKGQAVRHEALKTAFAPSTAAIRKDRLTSAPAVRGVGTGIIGVPVTPLVERSSTESHRTSGVQSGEGAGASTSATTAPTQVAGGPALLAKAKRRERLPTSPDDFRAKPLPDDQASAMGTDSPATLPSRRDAQSPEGRKRTIMARYVFGNELKPGERWKRRLLASR